MSKPTSTIRPTTPDPLDVIAAEFDEALEQRLAHEELMAVNKQAARTIARDNERFVSAEFAILAGMMRYRLDPEFGDVLSGHGFLPEDV